MVKQKILVLQRYYKLEIPKKMRPLSLIVSQMKLLPSEYFKRQIFATFFNDPTTRILFPEWGTDNCMWSNDYPHSNSTWPKSREVIARDLGHLSEATRANLLHGNVTRLYNLPTLALVPLAA